MLPGRRFGGASSAGYVSDEGTAFCFICIWKRGWCPEYGKAGARKKDYACRLYRTLYRRRKIMRILEIMVNKKETVKTKFLQKSSRSRH